MFPHFVRLLSLTCFTGNAGQAISVEVKMPSLPCFRLDPSLETQKRLWFFLLHLNLIYRYLLCRWNKPLLFTSRHWDGRRAPSDITADLRIVASARRFWKPTWLTHTLNKKKNIATLVNFPRNAYLDVLRPWTSKSQKKIVAEHDMLNFIQPRKVLLWVVLHWIFIVSCPFSKTNFNI